MRNEEENCAEDLEQQFKNSDTLMSDSTCTCVCLEISISTLMVIIRRICGVALKCPSKG